jgi:predicted anti-sigma-YlaC factor YlaD
MDCKKIGILLSAYVDREITDEERQRVENHLKVCEGCKRMVSEFSEVRRLYQDMAVKEPLPGFRQRVTQRIEKKPRLSLPRVSWSLSRPAYVLSLTLLILVGGIIALQVAEQPALQVVDVYAEDILFDQAGFTGDDLFSVGEASIVDEMVDTLYFDEADDTLLFDDETPSQDNVSRHPVSEWYV